MTTTTTTTTSKGTGRTGGLPHADLYTPSWADTLPEDLASEILPGLWMGGTDDDDWIDTSSPLHPVSDSSGFTAVVTLFAWARPMGWNVEELRFGFADADPRLTDMGRVLLAAEWALQRWQEGQRVLIRCQAGLNRSGLVTALVLMLAGYTARDAITLLRERRSSFALCNAHFIDWLVRIEGDLIRHHLVDHAAPPHTGIADPSSITTPLSA
jgi:hypothetical protein